MNYSPCDTCAFGSVGAANEPRNRLVAAICVTSGRPFFCHHSRSGEEVDWHEGNAVNFYDQPPAQRKVCEGWRRQVAQLAAQGHFRLTPNQEDRRLLLRYQRALGAEALRELDTFIAEDGPPKQAAKERLESLLEALYVHRTFELIQLEVSHA